MKTKNKQDSAVINSHALIPEIDNEIALNESEYGERFNRLRSLRKRIDDALEDAKEAMESADAASRWVKDKHGFWIFKFSTKNTTATINNLQKAVTDLAKAQQSAAEAQKVSFEFQEMLGQITRYLFDLGAANIAANRSVVKRLKEELEGASQSRLNELAKQEYYSVLRQLKDQLDLMFKVENHSNLLKELDEELYRLKNRLDVIEKNDALKTWYLLIDEKEYNGTSYFEQDDYFKIACVAHDFYDITKGNWLKTDLLFLKKAMVSLGLKITESIDCLSFLNKVNSNKLLRDLLFSKNANYKDISKAFEKIIDINPKSFDFVCFLLSVIKNVDKAHEEKSTNIAVVKERLIDPLKEGKLAYEQGNYIVAYTFFTELMNEGNSEAEEELSNRFINGNDEVQYNLGIAFEEGNNVNKDIEEAIKWYRRAADKGNAAAQNWLGWAYWENIIKSRRRNMEGFEWFQKAASNGCSEAQYNLGSAFEKGKGVKKDIKEAIKWYRRAAKQGDQDAKEALKRLKR